MRILSCIKNKIADLENYYISFFSFCLAVIALVLLRSFFEGLLEEKHVIGVMKNVSKSGSAFFRHLPLFFTISFLFTLLSLRIFTWEKTSKTAKIALFFLPLILIPPFCDFLFTAGQGSRLLYIETLAEYKELMLNFFFFWRSVPGASIGIRIEITFLMNALFIYVLFKTHNPFKALGAMALTFASIGLLGSIPFILTTITNFILKISSSDPVSVQFLFKEQNCFINTRDGRIEIVMMCVFFFSAGLLLLLNKNKILVAILKDFRWTRYLHYMLVCLFGFLVGYKMIGVSVFDFTQSLNYFAVFVHFISLSLVFESAVLFNDIYDRSCDQINEPTRPLAANIVSEPLIKTIAWSLFALALIANSIQGLAAFIMILILWIISYFYSFPPFHLKKIFPLNIILLGIESVLCFMYGFSFFGDIITPQLLPWGVAGVVLLYTVLSASVKDIKDYKGDKIVRVQTIVTMFGLRWGKVMIGSALFISFTLCPFLLGLSFFSIIGTVLGAYCFFALFEKTYREWLLFLLYFIFLIVVGLFYLKTVTPVSETKNPLMQDGRIGRPQKVITSSPGLPMIHSPGKKKTKSIPRIFFKDKKLKEN